MSTEAKVKIYKAAVRPISDRARRGCRVQKYCLLVEKTLANRARPLTKK